MQPTVNDRTMPTGYLLEKTGVVEGAYRWLLALEEAREELDADDRNLDRLRYACVGIIGEIDKYRESERIVFHTCPECGGTTVEDLNDDDTLRDHAKWSCTCDPWK